MKLFNLKFQIISYKHKLITCLTLASILFIFACKDSLIQKDESLDLSPYATILPEGKYIKSKVHPNINIVWGQHQEMFNRLWWYAPSKAQITELVEQNKIQTMINTVENALKKYPVELLANELHSIYIVKSLNFFGVPYGGTNDKTRVFVIYDFF